MEQGLSESVLIELVRILPSVFWLLVIIIMVATFYRPIRNLYYGHHVKGHGDTLLRSLYSAIWLGRGEAGVLDAETVDELAKELNLSTEKAVEKLQEEGMVKIRWGGHVVLTEKGRAKAEGRSANSPQVQLGDGAIFMPNAQISGGSAVGLNAMAKGSIRIEMGRGDLLAALQSLRLAHGDLDPRTREAAQALEGRLVDTLEEAQKDPPDEKRLQQSLARAQKSLDAIVKLDESGRKLTPTLQLIGQGLLWIARAAGIPM